MSKVLHRRKNISDLTSKNHQEMFDLFEQYYNDVSFEMFLSDLLEKDHVFILRNEAHELIGFSTIFRRRMGQKKKQYTALFSGDTVIRKDYWGNKALQKAFFFYILESKFLSGTRPLYWFLQSKGFKTYMMMRKNFRHSFPKAGREIPRPLQKALNEFYQKKYGENFKVDAGLIQFPISKGAAKIEHCKPEDKHLSNEDIQFFLKKNPGYFNGDELACIAEIRYRDFLFHIPKYFLKLPIISKLFKRKTKAISY